MLLDWQNCRYGSPIHDLVYFIFSSTDYELRAKHYDQLLKIYHESLKQLLDRLGGDTESQFPFTVFQQELKKFGKFGIVMASMVIPGSSTKNEDFPDMNYTSEGDTNDNPDAMKELFAAFAIGNETTKHRMRAAVMDNINYGYL